MSKSIMVWDPLICGGHWIIATAFALAYFTEEDLLSVHVWAGYVVGVAVVIRTLWGFVGPNRVRFSDFIYPPRAVLAYLNDLVRSCPAVCGSPGRGRDGCARNSDRQAPAEGRSEGTVSSVPI